MLHKLTAIAMAMTAGAMIVSAKAADPQVARGQYLVRIMGCTDCHTPGHFLGHPDMSHFLAGSDVGFGIPGLGVFVAPT